VIIVSRNRKAWRNKQKLKRIEQKKLDVPMIQNEFGEKDLTPYNALMLMSGRMTVDALKY
jgi:hypothetical protein